MEKELEGEEKKICLSRLKNCSFAIKAKKKCNTDKPFSQYMQPMQNELFLHSAQHQQQVKGRNERRKKKKNLRL